MSFVLSLYPWGLKINLVLVVTFNPWVEHQRVCLVLRCSTSVSRLLVPPKFIFYYYQELWQRGILFIKIVFKKFSQGPFFSLFILIYKNILENSCFVASLLWKRRRSLENSLNSFSNIFSKEENKPFSRSLASEIRFT